MEKTMVKKNIWLIQYKDEMCNFFSISYGTFSQTDNFLCKSSFFNKAFSFKTMYFTFITL